MKAWYLLILTLLSFSGSEIAKKETIRLHYQWLGRSNIAQHVGSGDEELKEPQRVRLTGTFTLKIEGGNLVGELFANFKEMDIGGGRGTDNTEFISRTNYLVFAKKGYKVVDFRILYDVHTTSSFNFMGRGYEQDDVPNGGPVLSINWKGDTGIERDQIHGCVVTPRLKRIDVTIEEIK